MKSTRLMPVAFAAVILLIASPKQVFALTAVKGTVRCSSGIVRESASTSAACAFCVRKGDSVIVLSEEDGKDGNKWYKIRILDQTGYIRSDLVTKSKETVTIEEETGKEQETAAAEPAKETAAVTAGGSFIGTVKGTGVNVRKEPATGGVVTKVTAGDKVTVSKSTKDADGNVWYAISFAQNKQAMSGYIRSDFVEGAPEGTAAAKAESAPTVQEPSEKKGFIRGTGVRIREDAVTGPVVVQLGTGHDVTILDEKKGEDNYVWYRVRFSYQGATKEGYVRSDLVNVAAAQSAQAVPPGDETFEASIAELPASYKNGLRLLHAKYPLWKFIPVNTGLSWTDVLNAECVIGKNLTSMKSIASWKSKDPRAYNSEKGIWYGFDGGSWASASPEIIRYYLDPRNFLDESGIFQFETLEYQDYQNETGTGNILAYSFMNGSFTDTDGVTKSYAGTFVEAGRANGISPYHLAARCMQEQGLYGESECVKGNVAGYEGLFNFFNIGAYAANGLTAPINGLIYASGTDENYYRPWNSRTRSILGAAKYISEKYVKKGQNTLYFQKFNVVNAQNGIYSHQYMSNICAAASEGAALRKAYSEPDTDLVFRIPYYSDMPDSPAAKPGEDAPVNTTPESITVE
ncbi:MAG: SH3 domain-containing protein [Lachnospiraceae bacterium]|nr:SH3 domain-containing protein [Lachnospiraceae bacterium]